MAISCARRFPVLFLSHGGGPCFFMDKRESPMMAEIDKTSPMKTFLTDLSQHLPSKPKAIVVVSAHWEERDFYVSHQTSGTSLVYDYYGFPEHTYAPHLTYAAPTDLELSERIFNSLKQAGYPTKKVDRGFDHGVFIPLKLAFPKADVPIVQVSLKSSLDWREHIELGKRLAFLRDEEVLIVCSGQTTHNLGLLGNSCPKNTKKAEEFVSWMTNTLERLSPETARDVENQLLNIQRTAPHLYDMHPRTEHLIPLHVALGASLGLGDVQSIACRRIYSQIVLGSMALDSFVFN